MRSYQSQLQEKVENGPTPSYPADNKVLNPMSVLSHSCVYVTTLLFEALSGMLWATQGCSSLQIMGPITDRPTYFAIALHQSNARLPGSPQMFWGQPGVNQVAEEDHEGKRIPDEISEELQVSVICARCQGRWQWRAPFLSGLRTAPPLSAPVSPSTCEENDILSLVAS